MTVAVERLLQISLTGGALILAVLLLRLAARRAPRWITMALWVLVAVCVLQMLVHLEWLPFLTQSVLDETTLISWVISQLPTVRFVNPVVITR